MEKLGFFESVKSSLTATYPYTYATKGYAQTSISINTFDGREE